MAINNNFIPAKTISEIKMQLGSWRDDLNDLEQRIEGAEISDDQLTIEMENLETVWSGLKLTKEDLNGRLELAQTNNETSVEKDLIEMQDTIAKATTVFKRASLVCSSRALNLVQESLFNALSLSDSNQKETVLFPLKRSLMIIKLNPFYAHEHKRIDELLGSIDNELKQINGVREQKAKRVELFSSLCEKVVSIKTLDELKTILPVDLHSELKQVLYPTYYPVIANFDHLDLFNNRFTVEQIAEAIQVLLKRETTVSEAPETSKEIVPSSTFDLNSFRVVPADSLLTLPTEVLLKIFQFINNRRDYRCLSLACRYLREISIMNGARLHALQNPSIPEFLQCDSYSASSMTREAILLQSKTIENNIKMKKGFNYKDVVMFPKSISNIPHAVIGDHFVYQKRMDSLASVHPIVVQDLKTLSKKEITTLNCIATTIVPVHGAPNSLLVTAIRGGFKIWDFEALKSNSDSKAALLLEVETGEHPTTWLYAPPYKELMVHSFNNFLIVGDLNLAGCLYFIDCSQEFKKENVHKVYTKEFKQIIINEDQAFVVNPKEITVWNVEKVKECIANKQTIDPKHAAQTWKFNENIGHVKVLENEVVVAYDESKRDFSAKTETLGVLLKRTDGTLIRKLSCNVTSKSSKAKPLQCMDTSDHMLISSNGKQMTFWDMDTKQDVLLQSVNFDGSLDVRKISTVGRHILFVLPSEVMLFNQYDTKKIVVSWNSKMQMGDIIDQEIESCDIFGRYLITVNNLGSYKLLYIYDLLQDCDAVKNE